MRTEPENGWDPPAPGASGGPDAGGRILGVGVGLGSVLFYAILPAVLVVSIWTFVCVYAIVKWAGSAPDDPNPIVLVVGVVMLVTLLVLLIAAGTGLVGRAMNPKKRAR